MVIYVCINMIPPTRFVLISNSSTVYTELIYIFPSFFFGGGGGYFILFITLKNAGTKFPFPFFFFFFFDFTPTPILWHPVNLNYQKGKEGKREEEE